MRVTNGVATRRRRNRWLDRAEGYFGTKNTSYKVAKQMVISSSQYSYRDRRTKKRDFRKLWITRLNGTLRSMGFTYSAFIAQLKKKNIMINRKMLSELAISNPNEFANLVKETMEAK